MKLQGILFAIFFGFSLSSIAQFSVPLPQTIAPTQRIYLSPNGNDANAGTQAAPKKTFQSAIASFSFGVTGVNNSESYNEVVFLPGDYYPTQTLSQNPSQYLLNQSGIKRYKNISVRGIGQVIIHGDSAVNVGSSALMALMGSHIYVKNITLRNSNYGGIKFIGGNRHCTNIEVDSLVVDGAPSHGCLFVLADTLSVKNSVVTNTCNENSDETASNCQWGSGLKTEYCTAVTFVKNKVFRNWGEGINTSLSALIYCYKNEAYDNYSTNFYLHSAAKGIWDSNLVYNSDSAFWRGCYNNGKRIPPSGISIANELTCTYACVGGGNNNACGGKYHCCAYTAYDATGYQFYPYRQTDSLFVYNNVLLQCDMSVWDAFSGFLNYAFIKDIYIENNTVVGVSGRPTLQKSPINVTLGTSFVYAQNIRIRNNIFTQDTALSVYKSGLSVYIPSGVCNGLTDGNIVGLNNNRWNTTKICTNNAINLTTEQILASLPTAISPAQLSALTPNTQYPYWIQTASPASYITQDFFGNARQAISNVGAIEKNTTNSVQTAEEERRFTLYPNPAQTLCSIETAEPSDYYQVIVWDTKGNKVKETALLTGTQHLDVSTFQSGVYFVQIITRNPFSIYKKLVVFR